MRTCEHLTERHLYRDGGLCAKGMADRPTHAYCWLVCLHFGPAVEEAQAARKHARLTPAQIDDLCQQRATPHDWTATPPKHLRLGDATAWLLHAVSLDRLAPAGCGCKSRQAKLNRLVRLPRWAPRWLARHDG